MTITLSAARTKLRLRLDETTSGAWTDAQLDEWIRDGARDISRRTMALQGMTTLSVLANAVSVTAPATTLKVSMVKWYNPTKSAATMEKVLEDSDHRQANRVMNSTDSGQPPHYSTWGTPPSIGVALHPKPDAACEVELYTYKVATDPANDSANVDIPDGWTDVLMLFAEYSAQKRDRQPEWKDTKALYEQAVEGMIESTAMWAEATQTIQMPDGGQYPGWLTSWE